MRRMSATEVARCFSQVLDEVEASGESVLVVRHGRPLVKISPAEAGNGARLRALLTEFPEDAGWADEVRELRQQAGGAPDRWNG